METFGERLKHLRKALNLTQVELGALVGLKGASVAQVEANSSRMTEAAIKLICATYKVNYLWLTEGAGEMWQGKNLEDLVEQYMAGESPLAISIMKSFVRLPDEEWVRLRDLIDRIKKEGLP